jgi:DNA-binding NarL/FixJ family response regulator
MVKQYKSGATVEAVGNAVGISAPTARRILREAGVKTRAGRRKVVDARKATAMIKRYKKGSDVREVAAKAGVSYGTAHRVLSTAEVLRTRGTHDREEPMSTRGTPDSESQQTGRKPRMTPELFKEVTRAYLNGESPRALGERYGFDRKTISYHLNKNGINRPPTEPRVSTEESQRLYELWCEGAKPLALASTFGYGLTTVYRHLRSHGAVLTENGVLTERQVQIMRLVVKGLNNTEIAAVLDISKAAVQSILEKVISRLEASNRMDAAVRAIERGLVPMPDHYADLSASLTRLRTREIRVLQLVREGLSDSEIDKRLRVSSDTAHRCLKRVYRLLNARNRTDAVMRAIHLRVIRIDMQPEAAADEC